MKSAPKTALVVDDNAFVRGAIGQMLTTLGFEVQTAGDGQEAQECIAKQKFPLIVTDLIMPKKSGFELIKELRRRDHGLKIIAISGAPESVSDWARSYGADAIMRKPIERSELAKTLATLFPGEF